MGFTFRLAAVTSFGALIAVPTSSFAASMRYDCDTTAGAYSEIMQAQTGPDYTLRTEIVAKRLGKHPTWRPGATVMIKSADGMSAIGFQLSAESIRSQTLSLTLFARMDGKRTDYDVSTIKIGENARVAIIVKEGRVRAEMVGKIVELPKSIGAGGEVTVSCSTGQFIFETLDIAAAS